MNAVDVKKSILDLGHSHLPPPRLKAANPPQNTTTITIMFLGNKKLAIFAAIVAIFGIFLAGPVDADGGLRIFDTNTEVRSYEDLLVVTLAIVSSNDSSSHCLPMMCSRFDSFFSSKFSLLVRSPEKFSTHLDLTWFSSCPQFTQV